jgi:hypothetical protein
VKIKDYPREILVGEELWKIRWKRKIIDNGVECLGLCCSLTKTIYIRLGQNKKERLSTLYHEVLHAIEYSYGIEIPHQLVYDLEGPLSELVWLKDA